MTNPSQPDPLVGKVLAERFEILSRIGEGGTGVVYKAKQITVDRVVAIKVLGAHVSSDPAWVKRFHNEARAAARLDHPNTVRLIDFGETKEGLFFIAMEFLQGRALSDEITKRGNLAPQRVLKILSQVCQSLSEAHTQGIIHRDIKPDNIFLIDTKGGGDFVKVLDFSVAKMEGGDAQQTRAGTVFGTPQYMSPEQARGAKLSPQSDLYSCGIVAYEMLTGKPPFEGALPMEVLMMHLRNKPAPLVGFPEAVSKVVMKALEKTPERRQASAEEMHRDCLISLEQQYPGSTGSSAALPITEINPRPSAPSSNSMPSGPPLASSAGANLGPPPMPSSTGGSGQPPMMPPPSAPPAQGVRSGQVADQKTLFAQPAPQLSTAVMGGGAANRTLAAEGGGGGGGIHSTVYVPGNAVGTAPSAQAIVARQQAMKPRKTVSPPKPLFWVSWALIGMGLGMLLHIIWTN